MQKLINLEEYQDVYGFYHHIKHPRHNSSENPSLFSAGVDVLCILSRHTPTYSPYGYFKKFGNYVTHITSDVLRFSHDNMTGMYIGYFLRGADVKQLPIIKWKSKKEGKYDRNYWLHPRDIITYLIFRGNYLGYLLAPLLLLFAALSFTKEKGNTSGKCKYFYVFGALLSKGNKAQRKIGILGMTLGEILCEKEHGKNPFIDIFSIYFKDTGYPNNILIKEYYARLRPSTED